MSDRPSEFLTQAQANLSHLNSLPPDRFDWQITTCFYTALHAINTVLSLLRFPTTDNHLERFALLRSQPVFRPIMQAYQNLFKLSILSRYEAEPISSLEEESVEARQLLESIWTFCERFWVAKGLS